MSEHRIKWYVWTGGEKIPHTASMRGTWGWDAVCSCGWESRTGGAVRSYVQDMVNDHKAFSQDDNLFNEDMSESTNRRPAVPAWNEHMAPLASSGRTTSRWTVWIAETASSMMVDEVTVRASSEESAYRIANETYHEYVIRAVFPAE